MTLLRSRAQRAALSLALALALAGIMGAMPAAAHDTPEAVVNAFLEAVAAKEFDQIGDLVCDEEREAVLEQYDLAASFAEVPGFDGEAFLEAFEYSLEDLAVSPVSETGGEAVVAVSARISIEMDETLVREPIAVILEASGQEPTEEAIDDAVAVFQQGTAEGQHLDGMVRVVRTDGAWLICDNLSELNSSAGAATPSPSLPPAEGNLCDLISLDELDALGPLTYGSADASLSDNCVYLSDDASAFHSLSLLLDTGLTDIAMLRQVFPDAQEMTAAGLPALFSGTELYVATDAGAFMVSAYVPDEAGVDLDLATYLAAFAEIAVPRLSEMPALLEASLPPQVIAADSPICDLISLDELNALGPLQFTSTSSIASDCIWHSAQDAANYSLTAWMEDAADIADLESYLGDLKAVTVAGLPAAFDGATVYVAAGEKGVIGVLASIPSWNRADLRAYAVLMAEVIAPRWIERP